MKLTAQTWSEYVARLARLNQSAGQLMADYIAAHGTGDTDALIAYAHALVTKYGEGSAELACQMYDALAAAAKAGVPAAEPAQPASYGEVARMVQATKASQPQMQQGVSRLVKRAGADTTLKNALRDGAEFAWIPQGDTCAFCLTLASRGWQKASQAAIKGGHAEHIHANCDCEYAIRFDGTSTVAGYDPDKYLRQYRAADGDINKLRRVNYAANKERINAQKRAAYALRQKNRGQKVAITDIAIQKVPLVAPNGADHQTAFFIQETHKELLRFAQKQNGSNEVACLLDLTTGEKLDFVKGDQISVDIEGDAASYHWLRNSPEKSLMLCHNHPGQSYFSDSDLVLFLEQLAAERKDAVADVPFAAFVDALLHELREPALQVAVDGDLLDERVGALRQHRRRLDLDVVIEVDAQLLDEGPQDALEEGVDRQHREARVVVQDFRTHLGGAFAHRTLVERQLAAEVFQIGACASRGQTVDLLQDARFHLLGGLVGEGHGEDVAVNAGLFDHVAHVFVRQLVGLARPCACIQNSRPHCPKCRFR